MYGSANVINAQCQEWLGAFPIDREEAVGSADVMWATRWQIQSEPAPRLLVWDIVRAVKLRREFLNYERFMNY